LNIVEAVEVEQQAAAMGRGTIERGEECGMMKFLHCSSFRVLIII
jgi:hypothetical protein